MFNPQPPGHNFVPPMAEETVEKTSQKIQSSIRDLGIIARDLLKGSRAEESLMNSAKQFSSLEPNIESTSLLVSRLEILAEQSSLNAEAIETALTNMDALRRSLETANGRIAERSSDKASSAGLES